jgi:DNA invertase Pin-like site-specific DNA recombinase
VIPRGKPTAKLTEEDRVSIYVEKRLRGLTYDAIAAKRGLNVCTVLRVVKKVEQSYRYEPVNAEAA